MPAAVTLRGITKRFPGVVANDAVDFEAVEGEVHALLGENGAGKSTLSNILTGLYRPDDGEILIGGALVSFHSPRDALDAGICMVHQHFRLVPPFTVAENVILGDHRGEGKKLMVHPRRIERRVAELGERYRIAVDPRARIWQLSLGEQQRVEILKALYREARILILDEPTAVLTPQEADSLFETVRVMAAEGRTVIFISHKLHEVKAVSDRVTVLRGGKNVETVDTKDATQRSLAALMVGRDVAPAERIERDTEIGAAVLELRDLWSAGDRGDDALRGVTLTVHAGEIVAIAGVAGNGQRELAETVTGMRPASRGEVAVDGRKLRVGDAREAIRAGVAHVPEDRLHTGVAPSLSIASNVALKAYRGRELANGPLLRLRRIREHAVNLIRRYDVRGGGPDLPARQLSGGNLQKVVLAREFDGSPRVLVVASPTRGLDVAAIETVHRYLREAAANGVGVLLISEDLDEILALADRIAVMFEGAIVGEVDAGEATVEELGLLMAGGDRRMIRVERRLAQPKWLMVAVPVGSVVVAFGVMSLVLLATHHAPGATFRRLFDTGFVGSQSLNATFIAATPLVFTGLCAAIAFRMQLFNIGGEGQLYAGAVLGAAAGIALGDTSGWLSIPAMIAAGAVGGALLALIPAILRAFFSTNEIITSLMLNYVAALVLSYLIFDSLSYWRDTSSATAKVFPQGKNLPAAANWPAAHIGSLVLPLGLLIGFVIAVGVWLLYTRTRFGFEVQVIGDSPRAASYAGMRTRRKILAVMALSGAVAGIGGASQDGDFRHTLDPRGLTAAGYGYAGIVIAALARYNPFAVCLIAILLGGLQNAGYALQGVDFPSGLVGVMQGLILFCALGGELLIRYRVRFVRSGHAAEAAT